MGADLFGSFAESTCAALVIAAAAVEGSKHTLSAAGWETWLCGPSFWAFWVVGVFMVFVWSLSLLDLLLGNVGDERAQIG